MILKSNLKGLFSLWYLHYQDYKPRIQPFQLQNPISLESISTFPNKHLVIENYEILHLGNGNYCNITKFPKLIEK